MEESVRWPPVARPAFVSEDFDLLVMAIGLQPDLEAAVCLLKEARSRGVSFPVESQGALIVLLATDERIEASGHRIDAQAVREFMDPGFFPLRDDLDTLAATHISLSRCTQSLRQKAIREAAKREHPAQAESDPSN